MSAVAYDRRAGVVLRIEWCERWLAEGHKQLTPEWENLLEDAKWLLSEIERITARVEDLAMRVDVLESNTGKELDS